MKTKFFFDYFWCMWILSGFVLFWIGAILRQNFYNKRKESGIHSLFPAMREKTDLVGYIILSLLSSLLAPLGLFFLYESIGEIIEEKNRLKEIEEETKKLEETRN